MTMQALLKKLAVERCQHNLAQMSAVLHLGIREPTREFAFTQACQYLIESINRDLAILGEGPEDGF